MDLESFDVIRSYHGALVEGQIIVKVPTWDSLLILARVLGVKCLLTGVLSLCGVYKFT